MMSKKDEINRLFQKIVDKTISPDELQMFYAYIRKSEHDPQVRRLLAEAWLYVDLTEKDPSAGSDPEGDDLWQKKQRLLEELIEDNEQLDQEIAAAIDKIRRKNSKKPPKNRIRTFYKWLKRFLVLA